MFILEKLNCPPATGSTSKLSFISLHVSVHVSIAAKDADVPKLYSTSPSTTFVI